MREIYKDIEGRGYIQCLHSSLIVINFLSHYGNKIQHIYKNAKNNFVPKYIEI